MSKRKYTFLFDGVSFNKEDKRGFYRDGVWKNGWVSHNYINQCIKCDDGKWHTVAEHILKWVFYNGEIEDGMEIDHINGDKQDNRLENLRCVSHYENCNNDSTKINITNGLKRHFQNNPEDRDRLSILHRGKIPWNKGKTGIYDDETKHRMSDAAKINYLKRDRNNLGQFIS